MDDINSTSLIPGHLKYINYIYMLWKQHAVTCGGYHLVLQQGLYNEPRVDIAHGSTIQETWARLVSHWFEWIGNELLLIGNPQMNSSWEKHPNIEVVCKYSLLEGCKVHVTICHPGQLKSSAQSSGPYGRCQPLWLHPGNHHVGLRPGLKNTAVHIIHMRKGVPPSLDLKSTWWFEPWYPLRLNHNHGPWPFDSLKTMIPFVPSKNCWQDGCSRENIYGNQITRQNPYDCKSFGIKEVQYSIHTIRMS